MNILVTGGAGFIGSHLVDALVARGDHVFVIDDLSTGVLENLPKGVTLFHRSIAGELDSVFEKAKPEVVFHLAAQIDVRKSTEQPRWDAEQNIVSSLNLFDAMVRHGCKRIIFSSTGGALYGDGVAMPTPEETRTLPESPYGIAKLAIEHYLDFYKRSRGFHVTVLRYSNVYGPRQAPKGEAGVVAVFARRLLRKEQCIINGDGKQTRDYVFVKDVVAANLTVFDKNVEGTFNIGTGVETSVTDLYRHIAKITDYPWAAKHVDGIVGEVQRSALSAKKIAAHWQPKVKLDDGLAETVAWFKEHTPLPPPSA